MSGRRRSDVVVGVVVLLGIALVVFGVIWLKGSGFGREEQPLLLGLYLLVHRLKTAVQIEEALVPIDRRRVLIVGIEHFTREGGNLIGQRGEVHRRCQRDSSD